MEILSAQTGLTASVGIAPNKLLAKIASDLNKPDGMCRIGADNVHDILDGLPIEKLFGVGAKSLPGAHAAGARAVQAMAECATRLGCAIATDLARERGVVDDDPL